jgi:hypothetical protein
MSWRKTVIACAVLVLGSVVLEADTLTLRDGRRLQGILLSVRDGVIEFDAQRSSFLGGRERVRLDRDEVVQIELDRERDRFDNDSRRDNDGRRDGGRFESGGGGDGSGRPSGLRERDVRVDAKAPWTDTSIVVRAGQTVYFTARGRVRWGPGRQDGPAGERGSPRNDGRPIPSRPAASLIGRIGDDQAAFFIGDGTEGIRMRSGGTLFLGINDDYLADNAGAWDVNVAY